MASVVSGDKSKSLSAYEVGATVAAACQFDQRFSYCLYVPKALAKLNQLDKARVLVVIHGTERRNESLRDKFSDLAEEHGLIVLAPLFPAGINRPGELDDYKYVEYGGIRFDLILLAMLDEVGARYGVSVDKAMMFGFSGGAHLAHRFLFIHADRLSAVSVCAPGSVTLLDGSRDWWVGTRNLEQRFGKRSDVEEMAGVAVQLVVGENDLDTKAITHKPGGRFWAEGANDAGPTRVARLRSLADSLADAGISSRLDLLPGVGHERDALVAAAISFFAQVAEGGLA